MTVLFDKGYEFEFIDKHNVYSERITGLAMSFEIEKNLTELPNEATFRIINMNPAHREMIEEPEIYCSLKAGYLYGGQTLGQIFTGAITDAYSSPSGTDIVTEISVMDGFLNWRDEITSVSFSPHEPKAATLKKNLNQNSTAKNILQYAASDMGLPITFENGLEDYLFKNGFSYYGAAREAIARVCKAAGYRWTIQNNVINILSNIWSVTDSGIVIAAGAGMVGSPERLRRTAKQTAKVKDEETGKKVSVKTARPKYDGWRITSLLRPEIQAGDYFICRAKASPFTTGKTVRATNVRHAGSTEDKQWYTQIEASEQDL